MSAVLNIKSTTGGDEPPFPLIYQEMHRDGVQRLQIDHLCRLNAPPSDTALADCGKASVSALKLTFAGPPASGLKTILSWPRRLTGLQIICSPDFNSGRTHYPWGSGNFSIRNFMDALAPQKEHLQSIYYRACYSSTSSHAHDGIADFSRFSNLQALDVPLDLLWEESWDDDELNDEEWTPAKLDTVLPPSLRELVLDIAASGHGFYWLDEEDDASANNDESLRESKASKELFDWLLTIPNAKASSSTVLPSLEAVRINTENWNPPRGPLDCEHTRSMREAFHKQGVSLDWSNRDEPNFAEA